MIKIEKLKMVLYDFDDTLCIHKHHDSAQDNEHSYNVSVLKLGKDAWKSGSMNIHMKKFIDYCTTLNIRQGLISASTSYKHFVGKQEWVHENYGITLENFCVGRQEAKLEIMLAIAEAYGYLHDEILIVDDYYNNLERAANNYFQACTPMEVVNFVTDKNL